MLNYKLIQKYYIFHDRYDGAISDNREYLVFFIDLHDLNISEAVNYSFYNKKYKADII